MNSPEASLTLQTLGGLRLSGPRGELLSGRRKELALLAYLAARAPTPVPRAQLASLLWGERPETNARQSLRQALVRLKRAVDDVQIDDQSVWLPEGRVALDVRLFEADLEAGRLREAAERWGGDFFTGAEDAGGEVYRAWVEEERERLRQRLAWALERLVGDAERAGEPTAAARWAERWAAALPLDERAHQRLIEALRLAARPDEALARHAAFVSRVRRELRLEPSPAFLRLAQDLQPGAGGARGARGMRPSPGSAALFTPDLAGRSDAFGELAAAWAAAQAGSGAMVLVEGEEGIGKTRLCEEFLRSVEARRERACVLRARAHAAARETPWTTARELLDGLKDAPGVSAAPPGALAALGRIVPAVRERFPPRADAARAQWSFEEAVARTLAEVAVEVPVILFVDALPAADAASQELMLSLAQRREGRMLLLLTARSDELEQSASLAELRGLYGAKRLRLQSLALGEVETLLGSMLELAPEDRHALATRLHTETGGNPFYTIETVAALLDEEYLVPDARGVWRLAPSLAGRPLPVPTSVREAIGRRLARLSDLARRLAEAAAVLAVPAEPAVLQETASLSSADIEPTLDELVARRLFHAIAGGRFEVAQELARHAVYDLLPPPRRRALHRAALEALSARPASDPTARAALRYHRARAGSGAYALAAWARSRRAGLVTGVLTLVVTSAALVLWRRATRVELPVIAVGTIRNLTGPDTAAIARLIPQMLSTNLARVADLRVISGARMLEVEAQLRGQRGPTRVARQAGATALLEGALARREGGYRLDLQLTDLRTGAVLGAYSPEGRDAFALADSATAQIAAGLHLPAQRLRVADVTTTSLAAYRLFQEGLRLYYENDWSTAARLFGAALAEDSGFAMAAFYLARSAGGDANWERAVRLAPRATDRERLLILGNAAQGREDPAMLAIAETLVVRYPTDPAGHLFLANALLWNGDFLAALPHTREVLALDSLSLRQGDKPCRACDALWVAFAAYSGVDSLETAERIVRDWIARQPRSARAWELLSWVMNNRGRLDEAFVAQRTAASLGPGGQYNPASSLGFYLKKGEFETADRVLADQLRNAPTEARVEVLWDLTTDLRQQGRLREALARALEARRLEEARLPQYRPPYVAIVHAQVLQEMGRAREAAALWDSLAQSAGRTAPSPGNRGRFMAWYLTHEADALALVGDTGQLRILTDSVENLGRLSAFGRDRRLHHHVRGLLLRLQGRPFEAAAEFRRALYTPYFFTSTNLALGRALVAAGRPGEAVPVLQQGVRGPLDVWGLYATHTEMHEALAQAFDAAGQPDSAAVHYQWVLNAWKNADPEFRPRTATIRARLRVLGRA